jgi:hypothetical protein
MDMIIVNIVALASILGSFALLGLAAGRWGVDSRPSIGDSHAR